MPAASHRAKAKIEGRQTYFTAKPCVRGHVAERYTGSGACCVCKKEDVRSDHKKRYDKEYYKANAEKIIERAKQHNIDNPGDAIQRAKEWAKRNPEKRKVISMSYKARRRAQEKAGSSTAEVAAWIAKQKMVCYWCSATCKDSFHVDHYVPLSKGGLHEVDNLVVACPSCNLSKSARDPYEFAAARGRLF